MPSFEGNRETNTILGNREHRKLIFDFWGREEQANLFQGNKETGTPWEGLSNGIRAQVKCLRVRRSSVL